MIPQSIELAGMVRSIQTAESAAECKQFLDSIMDDREKPWAVDIETNAYPIFHRDFKIRLVQFGDDYNAFIFPVEKRKGITQVKKLMADLPWVTAHGAKYDLIGLNRAGLIKNWSDLADRYIDTRILTHLVDPRGREDGGIGQALKDVCQTYVDPDAKDSADELKNHFKTLFGKKCTVAEGFRKVPLFDETYLKYSGQDPILTWLLLDSVAPLVFGQQF